MSKDALFSFHRESLSARISSVAACLTVLIFCRISNEIEAAEFQTPNFIIRNAPNLELARQFGQTAEQCRKELAVLWLGEELPPWARPCPITVKVGNLGAGGETSMRFDNAHRFDFDWDMKIQGSAESIITAVLPHEITHMILASHFKEPIPRWIDEGAATFVENEKERQNYRRLLYQYLRTGRGIPFNQMFHMAKYPDDQMPLYAQGFSLAEFLIFQQGHRHYVDFAAMGMKTKNWPQAIYEFYGYENLGELQVKWNRWVDAGCPDWAQMSVDQPIFVRDSTQYVASRDFMPTRQPMILARATHSNNATEFDQRIVQASWESPSPAAATGVEAALPRQREPLHMALSQTSQNQPLTATLTPISESGKLVPYANNYNEMSYDAPSAIVAQPAAMQPIAARPVNIAPTQMQDSVSHLAAMANVEENSSPMHVRPEQRFYQSPQNTPPPSTEPVHDARVIYDWKIR